MTKKILLSFTLFLVGFFVNAQINPYPLVPIDTLGFVSPSKLATNLTTPDYVSKNSPTFKTLLIPIRFR